MTAKDYNSRSGSIDIAKAFFALCVIGIHTNLARHFDHYGFGMLLDRLFDLAVPFFFITSGFYLGKRMRQMNWVDTRTFLLGKEKHFIKIYIYSLIGYLPLSVCGMIREREGVIYSIIKYIYNIITSGINFYSWHMWYLHAMCLALAIFYLLRFSLVLRVQKIVCISILVYFTGIVLYATQNSIAISELYFKVFRNTRNGLFLGFPMLLVGVGCSTIDFTKMRKHMFEMLFCSILFLICNNLNLPEFVCLSLRLPTAASVFCLIYCLNIKSTSLSNYCGRVSEWIFYIHMYFVAFVELLWKESCPYIIEYLIVSGLAFAAASLLIYFRSAREHRAVN